MHTSLSIGCVIMAAGNASRFGSNKLAAEFQGKSLFLRALDVVPASLFQQVSVVTQYAEFLPEIHMHQFLPIMNFHPELGQSYTIRLGLESLPPCDGILFLVADQPLLRQESIKALLSLWSAHPDTIAALAHEGRRGNPCLFPARFFSELRTIQGDKGGSVVIRAHPDSLLLLEVPREELYDVDTAEELQKIT